MPIPFKGSQIICHYDVQYRWMLKRPDRYTELWIEREEAPEGQTLIAQCPAIFNAEIVLEVIDWSKLNGWEPLKRGDDFICRWTKRGISKVAEA